jgi:hypothetical protein
MGGHPADGRGILLGELDDLGVDDHAVEILRAGGHCLPDTDAVAGEARGGFSMPGGISIQWVSRSS